MSKTVPSTNDPKQSRGLLFGLLGISFIILILGGLLTSLGIGPWYQELSFPPFQPPAWVFTPAWVLILTLLAMGTWKLILQGPEQSMALTGIALILYGCQIVLNAGWSLLFFSVARPDFALGTIIVLDIVLAAMVVTYFRVSRFAGICLIPYLAWLLFATAINCWIVFKNPSFG